MRLNRLFEDKDPMVAKYEQQLKIISGEKRQDPETILLQAMDADPTPNYEYVSWILKQLRYDNIILPEDASRVKNALKEFHRIKKIKTVEIEKDVYKYDRVSDLEAAVEKVMGIKSRKEITKNLKLEGAQVIARSKNYMVIEMLTTQAAQMYAKGTKWCTSQEDMANKYMSENDGLFIIFKKANKLSEKLIQFTGDFSQFKDLRDDTTTMNEEIYGLLRLYFPKRSNQMVKYLDEAALKSVLDDEDSFAHLSRNPRDVLSIATNTNERMPDLEPYLLKDLDTAIRYWRLFSFFRWPEFQNIVATLPIRRKIDYLEDASSAGLVLSKLKNFADTLGVAWADICNAAAQGYPKAVDVFFDHYRSGGFEGKSRDHQFYRAGVTKYSPVMGKEANADNDRAVLGCIRHVKSADTWVPYGHNWQRNAWTVDSDELSNLIVEYIIQAKGGRRWPEAEAEMIRHRVVPVIMKYLSSVVKRRWPEVEPIVGNMPAYKFYK